MEIKIQRYNNGKKKIEPFMLSDKAITLLDAFKEIKEEIDNSFTYRSGCRSEVCGSCAVVVNGREKLACGHKIQNGDFIEPLRKSAIVKDLVVDREESLKTLIKAKNFLTLKSDKIPTTKDEKAIEVQSNCILCHSCYSSCPVLEVNKDFLGPFTLSRSLKYINDVRVMDKKEKVTIIQTNGVWDCTLCGECTAVCPQNIDPKNDILMLQIKSTQYGFSNPNQSTFENFDMGFNPNF